MENTQFLKDSLIYAMSLSSKELFHSNVWKWLMTNDHSFIKVFFPNFKEDKYNNISIERETHNRDIIIKYEDINGKKYYNQIENKIKSIPTVNQLIKYIEKIEGYECNDCVYTGIINPLSEESIFDDDSKEKFKKWRFINYKNISIKIKELLEKSNEKIIKKYKDYLNEYCEVIEKIYDILFSQINEDKLLYESKGLKDIRFKDVMDKLQASHFLNYLNNKKEDDKFLGIELPKGFHWSVFQNFHHGKACIDIRFSNYKDSYEDQYLVIGIEIEGNSYRYSIERKYKENKEEDIFKEFSEKGWFDETYLKNDKSKILFKNDDKLRFKSSMSRQYNKYIVVDKYIFIYQHFDLDEKQISYDWLYNRIKHDMEKAKNIIENK